MRRTRRRPPGADPLLPPSLLRLSTMRTGLGVVLPFFVVLGGFLFVHALVLQDLLGLSPLRAGLTLTPFGAAFLVLSLLASRLVARHGPRVLVAGCALVAAGLVVVVGTVLAIWPRADLLALAGGTLLLGAGFGAVSPTLFRIVLSEVPSGSAGVGSGVLTTAQQIATALGVATVGTLFSALRPETVAGPLPAVAVSLGLAATLAVAMAVAAGRLPDPTR